MDGDKNSLKEGCLITTRPRYSQSPPMAMRIKSVRNRLNQDPKARKSSSNGLLPGRLTPSAAERSGGSRGTTSGAGSPRPTTDGVGSRTPHLPTEYEVGPPKAFKTLAHGSGFLHSSSSGQLTEMVSSTNWPFTAGCLSSLLQDQLGENEV